MGLCGSKAPVAAQSEPEKKPAINNSAQTQQSSAHKSSTADDATIPSKEEKRVPRSSSGLPIAGHLNSVAEDTGLVLVADISELYDIQEALGKGSFGEVKAGICKADGQKYAIKSIKPRYKSRIAGASQGKGQEPEAKKPDPMDVGAQVPRTQSRRNSMEPQVPASEHSGSKRLRRNSDGGGQRDGNAPQAAAVEASLRSAHNEAYILARVKGHKHVVNLHQHVQDNDGAYVVMELCQGGDLMKYVLQCKHFSEKVASFLFRQMLLGIKHCHSRGVVHRDLKPDNFLFKSSTGAAVLKIADFGLGTIIDHPEQIMTQPVGSAFFIAPEVFAKEYTKACDAWSLGIILYLLLSGTVPFGAKATKASQVYHAIQTEKLSFASPQWKRISISARELVSGLLEKNPFRRYTLDEALQHPWVANNEALPDVPIDKEVVQSMYAFNANNKLRNAALKLVASTLTAQDVQRLRAQFHAMDTNLDQVITLPELDVAMKSAGIEGGPRVMELMKQLDLDGDGALDMEEFLAATTEMQLVYYQNRIWWAFQQYDVNKDGMITVEEVEKVLEEEGNPKSVQELIDEYDLDKDGKINYEEFIRMLVPAELDFQTVTLA